MEKIYRVEFIINNCEAAEELLARTGMSIIRVIIRNGISFYTFQQILIFLKTFV